jgi:hypothetical protein
MVIGEISHAFLKLELLVGITIMAGVIMVLSSLDKQMQNSI